ncbi:MAG: TVP38/TMEM64 family protein [Syntrophobacteraceae bacterium]
MNSTEPANNNTARIEIAALIKIAALIVFLVLAFLSVRYTSLRDYLTPQVLQGLLDRVGFWAPLAFMVFYAVGVCFFVPGTVLTGIGAAIFGPYLGFAYVYVGAMAGAVGAFLIGRTLGRDFAASLAGEKLKKYDEAIERNGFATVLYLRLIYFPFSLMNFGMGLTRVRFMDYLFGTALGILVGTFIFTFLIGTLKDIWVAGDWSRLISSRVFLAVALFVLSLFIPKAVKKFRGEG